MRIIIFLVILLPGIKPLAAQSFDTTAFEKKLVLAKWLKQYDKVAWKTTDVMQMEDPARREQLGEEWFCYEGDSLWYAVYGKFEDGSYRQQFHYVLHTNGTVKPVAQPADTAMANDYARALWQAHKRYHYRHASLKIRLNQYVKRAEDSTLKVWLLPAFQPNGMAVYGAEFYFHFDKHGRKLLNKSEHFDGRFKGFRTGKPRKVSLNYRHTGQPTLGAIYFAWYYKEYFDPIEIVTRHHKTILYKKRYEGFFWKYKSRR